MNEWMRCIKEIECRSKMYYTDFTPIAIHGWNACNKKRLQERRVIMDMKSDYQINH